MSFLSSFLLGLIQGIAEFLPISSSGHLAIAQNLLGMQDAGVVPEFFDVLLHLGTLVAVFVAYWGEIKDMVRELVFGVRDIARHSTPTPVPPARRLILLIIVGTLPLFAVLPVKDKVQSLSSNMVFIGAALIVTGFLLFASDRVRKGRKTEASAGVLSALIVGVGQAIATMPGISRSGSTITAGISTGQSRPFAMKYSLLMSIPAVLGANLLSLIKALRAGVEWSNFPAYLVGMVVSIVVGYFSIILLQRLLKKGKFGNFAYYMWGVGAFTLIASLF